MMRVLAVLLLLAVPLSAHTLLPTGFREVVSGATFIARGRVTDVRAARFPDRGIETIATIGVDHVIKGVATNFVSVHIPGGVLGNTRVVTVGAPRLQTGDWAVFFLKRGEDNGWIPVGLSMGIYRVHLDPRTRLPFVNPPVLEGATASVGRVVRGDARRTSLPVSEFESMVRLVMAGDRGGARGQQ